MHLLAPPRSLFLDVGISVYRGYLERSPPARKRTSMGSCGARCRWFAKARPGSPETAAESRAMSPVLRFVMIDEFQDFSQMFFELVNAIRRSTQVWSSSVSGTTGRRSMGSPDPTLRFFTDFAEYFRCTPRSATSAPTTGPPHRWSKRGTLSCATEERKLNLSVTIPDGCECASLTSSVRRYRSKRDTTATTSLQRYFD